MHAPWTPRGNRLARPLNSPARTAQLAPTTSSPLRTRRVVGTLITHTAPPRRRRERFTVTPRLPRHEFPEAPYRGLGLLVGERPQVCLDRRRHEHRYAWAPGDLPIRKRSTDCFHAVTNSRCRGVVSRRIMSRQREDPSAGDRSRSRVIVRSCGSPASKSSRPDSCRWASGPPALAGDPVDPRAAIGGGWATGDDLTEAGRDSREPVAHLPSPTVSSPSSGARSPGRLIVSPPAGRRTLSSVVRGYAAPPTFTPTVASIATTSSSSRRVAPMR